MDILKAIFLGVVQGLTEFLPVSSTGHLVIFSKLLNFEQSGITFEIFLHCGTLLSVLFFFRAELGKMIRSLLVSPAVRAQDPELTDYFWWNLYVVLATLPAVVVGLFFKDLIHAIFDNILVTFTMLAVTGILMFATKFVRERGVELNAQRSILIGMAQALAIMPGLSRSGSTVFAGLFLGLQREVAARFAFIMSIPAILGAVVLDTFDWLKEPPAAVEVVAIAAGTLTAALVGYGAIALLLGIVRRGKLDWFGYYCFALSGVGFAWHFLH